MLLLLFLIVEKLAWTIWTQVGSLLGFDNLTTSHLATQVQKKVFWSDGCPSCCCCRGEIFIKMICLQVHVTTSPLATQEQQLGVLVAGPGLRLDADSTLGCTSSIALLAPCCLYKQYQRGRALQSSDAVCLGSQEHSVQLVHTGLVRCEERTIWIWIKVGSLIRCLIRCSLSK